MAYIKTKFYEIFVNLKFYTGKEWKQYFGIFAPILACEFMWIFGENVYAAIYGNIGTDACAAMTMTGPIQGLMIGALSGLSQAAGIMIGKALGNNEYDTAYSDSKKFYSTQKKVIYCNF